MTNEEFDEIIKAVFDRNPDFDPFGIEYDFSPAKISRKTDRYVKKLAKEMFCSPSKPKKKQRVRLRYLVAAIIGASVLTVGVGAYSDGFGLFRMILNRTASDSAIDDSLWLVSDDISEMEENISNEKIFFDGNDTIDISTVGMYYDNNTMMISVEMKLREDINIPETACILPYFTKELDGVETELDNMSGTAMATPLIKGDTSDTYYATFYLTERNLADSSIYIRLENILTAQQIENCYDELADLQQQWYEEFGAKKSIEEWKQYWKENNFDERTKAAEQEIINESEKVLAGSWTSKIDIPQDMPEPIVAEKHGFKVTADTLSIALESNNNYTDGSYFMPVVTMKDGTVIFNPGSVEKQWLIENGVTADVDKQSCFAFEFGNVHSYSKPYPIETIADITVYVFTYNQPEIIAESYVIYEAEE